MLLGSSLIHDPDTIRREQRTQRGLQYDAWKRSVFDRYNADKEFRRKANALCERVAINPRTVHTNRLMNNLSIAYANDEYLAERIFGVVPVGQRSDTFVKWDKRNLMNAPNDLLSTRARAMEVQNEYSTDNYSVIDYGLKDFVDDQTLKNADDIFSDVFNMVEGLLERIALKRELRAAAVAAVAASYGGNSVSVAASEWNATSANGMYTGGNPVNVIRSGLAAMWSGRGRTRKVGFTSLDVFNVLSNHAQIRALFGLNDSGLATRQQIANYFGLDELLVSEARYDTANIGQTASYARIWGNVFGIVRVAATPSRNSAHFGSIFRLREDPTTTEWFDPDPGKSGGHYAKVAVSEQIKVIAPDTGYLITNVLV